MIEKEIKVKGINPYYSVEVEKKDKKVFITLTDVFGREMCVGISDKNWEKIKLI